MDIEYDPVKAAANLLNHEGVTFDEAQAVLREPNALNQEDRGATGEQRFATLGMGGRGRVLVVAWTLRGERIRLISAWKANPSQRPCDEQES